MSQPQIALVPPAPVPTQAISPAQEVSQHGFQPIAPTARLRAVVRSDCEMGRV
jgi:hypothetical protein